MPEALAQVEDMSPAFRKFHLQLDGWRAAVHVYADIDRGDPHDHPWGFTSHILTGGYIEEVFRRMPDGAWGREVVHRKPGTVHQVDAETVHRIIALPCGECRTLVLMGPHERVSRFWRFDGGRAQSRAWTEAEFSPS